MSDVTRLIRHKRTRKGILVPLLEDLFSKPVEIESEEDVEWLTALFRKMVERGDARNSQPLYSPSQFSECLRYVYLLKNRKKLGLVKIPGTKPQPNFYFFKGNWIHIQWQFAFYKLDKALPDDIFKLYDVEVPIISKHGDHGGTVDILCAAYGEPLIVDAKGLNVRTFGEITRGNIPHQYAIQITDYGMLYNSQRNGHSVTRGILLVENKGGPDPKHLIALHEVEIPIRVRLPEVRARLGELRKHEKEESTPPPECEGTQTIQFQGCPFRKFCREEVKAIERKRRRASSSDSNNYSVARPEGIRTHRSKRRANR